MKTNNLKNLLLVDYVRVSLVRLRVWEREGKTQGFVGADSSLSTNAYKPNSKSVNQTLNILLHTETVQNVCERERERERERVCVCVCVCVCVLPIDEKGMERREERREEGDLERVEVREGGECVESRGSLRSFRVVWECFVELGFFSIVFRWGIFYLFIFIYTESWSHV